MPDRPEQPAEDATDAGELAGGIGVLVVFVAIFGTLLDDLFDRETFLSETRWRWSIAWFGLLLITEGLGERTQALWKLDDGWSPRVVGHAIAASVTAIALVLTFVLAITGQLEV